MNMLIFGIPNNTTLYFIERALQEGHTVTAFIPAGSNQHLLPKNNLDVIPGDILNYTTVEEAMQGQEIVIDTMDIDISLPNTFFTTSACNIIKAMYANNVKRLILLSKIGAGNSIKQGPVFYRLWLHFIKREIKENLSKITTLEQIVRRSKLQWTIVRTVSVTENHKTESGLKISHQPGIKLSTSFISAGNVASFLLTIAVKDAFTYEIIGISGK